MYKRIVSYVVGATLMVSGFAAAQDSKPAASAKKEQAAGAKQGAPQLKTIYDYKDELGLSDTQVSKIRSTLGNFAKDTKAKRELFQAQLQEYARLVNDHAELDAIKASLKARLQTEFDLAWLDVTTARAIEDIMTPAQLKKWRALQSKARVPAKK